VSRALVALHVLIAACWARSLAPLALVTIHEDGAIAGEIVARFTALATFAVPLIAVAGLALAYLLGVRAETLARPYGLLLLAKIGGLSLLMLLAALNKWRLGSRLATNPALRPAFVTSVAIEGVLITGALAAADHVFLARSLTPRGGRISANGRSTAGRRWYSSARRAQGSDILLPGGLAAGRGYLCHGINVRYSGHGSP
jgi:hypothetical protein